MSPLLDDILQNIISRLTVRQCISFLSVSKSYQQVSLKCLRRQKRLMILEKRTGKVQMCPDHPLKERETIYLFVNNLDMKAIMSVMHSLEVVYCDVTHTNYNISIVKLLMVNNSETLKCLTLDTEWNDILKTLPSLSFPQLKHICFGINRRIVKIETFEKILRGCQNLTSITNVEVDRHFNNSLLPTGLRRMTGRFGLDHVLDFFLSGRASCLEELDTLEIPEFMNFPDQYFELPNMKRLIVVLDDGNADNALKQLIKLVKRCHRDLELSFRVSWYEEETSVETWNELMDLGVNITSIDVHGTSRKKFIAGDAMIESLVSKMPGLKKLKTKLVNAYSVRLLSSLNNLEEVSFYYTNYFGEDNDFDASAMGDFMETSFRKELKVCYMLLNLTEKKETDLLHQTSRLPNSIVVQRLLPNEIPHADRVFCCNITLTKQIK